MDITCTTCKKTYPDSDFYSKGNGKKHSQCKYCKRIAIRKHYQRNKSDYIARAIAYNKKVKKKLTSEINKLKDVPCADCGMKYPHYVMDFDHRPGTHKIANVADLVKSVCVKRALVEVEKCDIICANCHRIRTHDRKKKNSD
jgi:hypothetical protein